MFCPRYPIALCTTTITAAIRVNASDLIANPFLNNMIPLTRFSPVAAAIQNVLPTLSNSALYNNYNGSNPGQRIRSDCESVFEQHDSPDSVQPRRGGDPKCFAHAIQ